MKTEVWELAKKILVGLFTLASSVVITALIKGEPLTGLARLGTLWRLLKTPAVPVWVFATLLIFAFVCVREWGKIAKEQRRTLHIVWHVRDSLWHMGAVAGAPAMQFIVQATFTGRERIPFR